MYGGTYWSTETTELFKNLSNDLEFHCILILRQSLNIFKVHNPNIKRNFMFNSSLLNFCRDEMNRTDVVYYLYEKSCFLYGLFHENQWEFGFKVELKTRGEDPVLAKNRIRAVPQTKCQTSSVSSKAPDPVPVRILLDPDPGVCV